MSLVPLLHRVEIKDPTHKGTPLLAEFQVPSGMDAVLVTSTRGFAWVTPRNNVVRAASRKLSLSDFFAEVVDEVTTVGLGAEWGNVRELSSEGLGEVLAHLATYGFDADHLDALFSPGDAVAEHLCEIAGVESRLVSWVRPGHVVLIPRDRDFVGVVHVGSDGQGFAVVHNPSRAIGVLRPGAQP